jgi:hypothetical protein
VSREEAGKLPRERSGKRFLKFARPMECLFDRLISEKSII